MQLKTLVIAVLLPIMLVSVLGILFLKQKKELALIEQQKAQQKQEERQRDEERAEAKRRKLLDKQKKERPRKLVQDGEREEDREKWGRAAQCYKESLRLADAESTKLKLKAVNLVMEAEKLEKKEEWDSALMAYEKAREHVTNKRYVDERMEYIKGRNEYHTTYAKAEELAEAGKQTEAIGAYEKALKLAKLHNLKTDVRHRIAVLKKKTVGRKKGEADVFELIRALAARKDLFTLLAVYNSCITNPEFAQVKEKLEKEKAFTVALIKESMAQTPKSEDRRVVQLKLKKDGSRVAGELLEETKTAYRVKEISADGSTRNRLILRKDVASVTEASEEELTATHANRLFTDAVSAYSRKSYFETLKSLGTLQFKYPEASILKDAERQKTIIARQSIGLLKETGGSLDGLAAKAAKFCHSMCFKCNGLGWVPCKQCQGRGKQRHLCNPCTGKGKMPCDFCMATGRTGGKKCGVCKGKKTVPCPFCKGQGHIETLCETCAKRPCPRCRGRKREPIGPCTHCKGSGRVAIGGGMDCPKCGGTGIAVSEKPCIRCDGSGIIGMTRCAECRGTGVRAN